MAEGTQRQGQAGPRRTPMPKTLSPARGGQAVTGVERHTRLIAKRSKINPAVIVIVALFAIGAVAIIAITVAKRQAPQPAQLRPAPAQVQARPAPLAPAPAASAPGAVREAAAPEPPPRPKQARKVRLGEVTGVITEEGRDQRTVALLCPACGQPVTSGAATCGSCGQPLDWSDLPCPYCYGKPGSGVCAMCRGAEPRRMMAVEIKCPVCDGTKKCMRCDGTGKFKAQ